MEHAPRIECEPLRPAEPRRKRRHGAGAVDAADAVARRQRRRGDVQPVVRSPGEVKRGDAGRQGREGRRPAGGRDAEDGPRAVTHVERAVRAERHAAGGPEVAGEHVVRSVAGDAVDGPFGAARYVQAPVRRQGHGRCVDDAGHERLAIAVGTDAEDRHGRAFAARTAVGDEQGPVAVDHGVVHLVHAGRHRPPDVEERGSLRSVADPHRGPPAVETGRHEERHGPRRGGDHLRGRRTDPHRGQERPAIRGGEVVPVDGDAAPRDRPRRLHAGDARSGHPSVPAADAGGRRADVPCTAGNRARRTRPAAEGGGRRADALSHQVRSSSTFQYR